MKIDKIAESKFFKPGYVKNAIIVSLIIIVIALGVAFGRAKYDRLSEESSQENTLPPSSVVARQSRKSKDVGICETRACIQAANIILKNVDQTQDPCEDFNKFACGDFMKNTFIPDDRGSWHDFDSLSEDIYERARTILRSPEADDPEIFKKVKRHFRSCMDDVKQEELGAKPLTDLLQNLGGFPLLVGEQWDESSFNWIDYVTNLRKMGLSPNSIIRMYVYRDYRNSKRRLVHLDQADLGMSRDYLIKGFNDTDVQHYFDLLVSSAEMLGADPVAARQELKDALMFEINLALISDPKEVRRDDDFLNNPTVINNLEVLDGHPPSWLSYIQAMLNGAADITPTSEINVGSPAFLKKVAPVLRETKPRTVANYLNYRIMISLIKYLNARGRAIYQVYNKALNGQKTQLPDWKRCSREVGFNQYSRNKFTWVAASMYVKHYFPVEAKKRLVEMVDYIKLELRNILSDVDWMDDETRKEATVKLDKMEEVLGFPDEISDISLLEETFKDVTVKEDDFVGNVLRINLWNYQYFLGKLNEPVIRNHWTENGVVAVVNAFYDSTANSIKLPAGILQGAFYHADYPNAMNFGGIGAVIGHEYTHGFDDKGRKIDADGNLRNWWSNQTEKQFLTKAKCMVDQYGKIKVPDTDLYINGNYTQGENIADNGGMVETYRAYETWLKDKGIKEEPRLPGVHYTSRQLFWINYAATWCVKYKLPSLKKKLKTDPHPPSMYRIIIPLQNSKEFAKDFACPLGSKMNPVKKCKVW